MRVRALSKAAVAAAHGACAERKSGKGSARSAAFQAKKDALYAEARKNAETAVAEGVAYMCVGPTHPRFVLILRI